MEKEKFIVGNPKIRNKIKCEWREIDDVYEIDDN
jgi:hypothetical protein